MERTHGEQNLQKENCLLCSRTDVQLEHSQDAVRIKRIRAQNNGFLNKQWRIKNVLESYFEKHAKEVWEKNWMNPATKAMLFDTYRPKLMALCEQVNENDQLNAVEEIVGPVPEIPHEYEEILKGGGGFWDDVTGGYLPDDLVLAAGREVIEWVHSEGVYEIVAMLECTDSGWKLLDLIWVDTDKSVDPAHRKIRSRLCARERKTK